MVKAQLHDVGIASDDLDLGKIAVSARFGQKGRGPAARPDASHAIPKRSG